MAPEEIFVEGASRPSVLVVENNPEFARMANEGLGQSCNIAIAHTLEDVADVMATRKFDFILSGVMFPVGIGHPESNNTRAMLEMALKNLVPIAFITGWGRNCRMEGSVKEEMPFMAIAYLTADDAYNSLVLLKYKGSGKNDFDILKASRRELVNSETKDEIMWSCTLANLKTISLRAAPLKPARKAQDLFGGRGGFEIRESAAAPINRGIRRNT